jgi:hypothetical protein
MDAEEKAPMPGAIVIRSTRDDAERSPDDFYCLLEEFRGSGLLPLRKIAEACGDSSLNPEPNILRKIQSRTLSEQARAALLGHIFGRESLLFGASRRQVSAIADPLYFVLLNFLDAKDAVQDEARARVVGTYKLWRHALEHEDELALGKMTVSEDPKTHALMTDVIVARKSAHGLRGSCNRFLGYLFFVSRMYFMITRNRRTDDLRMTLFSRFRMDEVGTEINPRSIFAGRRNHIVHMDGITLGMDGSKAFVSPTHISLVDDVDELSKLDEFIDVMPQNDGRVPSRVVKRLMRCGPLRVL